MGFFGGGGSTSVLDNTLMDDDDIAALIFFDRNLTLTSSGSAADRAKVSRGFGLYPGNAIYDTNTANDSNWPQLTRSLTAPKRIGQSIVPEFSAGTEGAGYFQPTAETRDCIRAATQITFHFTVIFDSITTQQRLFSFSTNSANDADRFYGEIQTDGSITIYFTDGTNTFTENTGAGTLTGFNDNLPHDITVVLDFETTYSSDSGDILVYLDGALAYSNTSIFTGATALSFPNTSSSRAVLFASLWDSGGSPTSPNKEFDGAAAVFCAIRRALTANEITSLVTAINEFFPKDSLQIVFDGDSNTVGYPFAGSTTNTPIAGVEPYNYPSFGKNSISWKYLKLTKRYYKDNVQNRAVYGIKLSTKMDVIGSVTVDDTANTLTVSGTNWSTATSTYITYGDGGSMPGGVSEKTLYYVRSLGSNAFSLHPTSADATNNTNVVDITSTGSNVKVLGNNSGSALRPINITAYPGRVRVAVFDLGRNDMDASGLATAAETYRLLDLRTYIWQQAGWKVVLVTPVSIDDTDAATRMSDYCDLIVANTAGADAIADCNAGVNAGRFDSAAATQNENWYVSDNIHITEDAQWERAKVIRDAILTLI